MPIAGTFPVGDVRAAGESLTIPVVICTRHRPPSVRDAVRSVLLSRPAPHLVIIVDQAVPGTDDTLENACRLPAVMRIVQADVGLSRARNCGTAAAEAAGAGTVDYMDDDCEAEPHWLAGIASAFASAAIIGLVLGNARAAPYDRARGLIPAYEVWSAGVHRGIAAKTRVEGIGACMALRVDAWRRLEGFDETFGSGAELSSAEETDLVVRLILAGFAVAETADATVVHHGFRDWQAARPLLGGYMRGIGAAMAKMVRLEGDLALGPLIGLGARWLAGRPVVDLNYLPSPEVVSPDIVPGRGTHRMDEGNRPSIGPLPAVHPAAGANRVRSAEEEPTYLRLRRVIHAR